MRDLGFVPMARDINKEREILMMKTLTGRKAVTTLVAAALVAAVPFLGAEAASADSGLAAGTYTVTANVYVDSSDTPIGQNAYVTNPNQPPTAYPTSPVSVNATLVVQSDGTELLTVPIVNETFGVLSIAGESTDDSVIVEDTTTTSWSTWAGTQQRVSSITFDVTDFSGGTSIATFGPSTEYANFLLYLGAKDWDLHLTVDFDSAS